MMKRPLTEKEALGKLASLCSAAEHCQYEMATKLQQWGIDEEAKARIMQRLTEEKYVDDERYCRAFVNDKIHYAKWGRKKIEQALWMKHIDQQTQQKILDGIDENEYISVLCPQLLAKRRQTRANSEYELNMKLIKWAIGRGYTLDIIRHCLKTDIDDIDI